ncbi:MAG TPA: alanine--glyoxylate aminotransferase family protein [Pseudogracilibacillus sp.]|nr:alanine--glyoxylate aminotransferase family protein [Pseudogracilibacillus sp.]
MLQDYSLLRIPGPTPVPPSVGHALNKPMIGHRGKETTALLQNLQPRLQKLFNTKQEMLIVTGSGTAGLETAVVNVASEGDEVLVVVTGAFGDRFANICDAHHIKAHRLDVEWGEAADPEQIAAFLKENKQIKAVFLTHCETSTGVLNPIETISQVIHEHSDALVIVDGVSSSAGTETKIDEWGIDLYATGSQKAMMLPPGLAFIGVSERAWEVIENNKQGRFYLDLRTYRKNMEKDSVPYTPAIPLLFALDQALTLLEDEGLEKVYQRHTLMRDMTRAAVKSWNVPLLTEDEFASPTVTAVKPENFDPEALRKIIKEQFNLTVAGGQKHLSGKIFRIGHMGYCSPADILQTLSLIELGLVQLGVNIELGQGVQAAQQVYLNHK